MDWPISSDADVPRHRVKAARTSHNLSVSEAVGQTGKCTGKLEDARAKALACNVDAGGGGGGRDGGDAGGGGCWCLCPGSATGVYC